MQSNPYVYPFVPFVDLSNKKFLDHFSSERTVTIADVRALLARQQAPVVTHKAIDTAERILEIFLDPAYCYGPTEHIIAERIAWVEQLNFFIRSQTPIQFIILGFPFKIPVPLKTDRTLPDMGEVLALHRLFSVTELIREIYTPGATITIFTEGTFGKFVGVSDAEANSYRDQLSLLVEHMGYAEALHVRDLHEVEAMVPDFWTVYEQVLAGIQRQYNAQEPGLIEKFNATFPSVCRIVDSRSYAYNDLLTVYDDAKTDAVVDANIHDIRAELREKTTHSVLTYHAYHETRYKTGVMDRVAPHALYLTVSPKRGRLGVYPIAQDVVRLPYHGVPVLHSRDQRFSIEYLVDIRREAGPFQKVFLDIDKEQKPFYYEGP